jgi:NTP pyrophosphatase (non-canonical NTP hydrolase)
MRGYDARVDDLSGLTADLGRFAAERGWGRGHTPKNLAMALAAEVGELLAEFQWLSDAQIRSHLAERRLRDQVQAEVADVFIYLLLLSDSLGIDLTHAAQKKMEENAQRFLPADSVDSGTHL